MSGWASPRRTNCSRSCCGCLRGLATCTEAAFDGEAGARSARDRGLVTRRGIGGLPDLMLGWSIIYISVSRLGAKSEGPDSQAALFYFSLINSHDCISADLARTNPRPNRDREKVFRGGRRTQSPRSGAEKL